MLVINNKRYTKKHVIGGSVIFDTIFSFGKKLLTSNAAKQAASALAASSAKQAGKHIVDRMLRPASQAIPLQPIVDIQPTYQAPQALAAPVYQALPAPAPRLSQKVRDDLTNLIHQAPPAHLMAISSSGSAIKIQDLVKRKGRSGHKGSGAGMKISNLKKFIN